MKVLNGDRKQFSLSNKMMGSGSLLRHACTMSCTGCLATGYKCWHLGVAA